MYPLRIEENFITRQLLGIRENLPFEKDGVTYQQLSLFDDRNFGYDGKQLVQPESAGGAQRGETENWERSAASQKSPVWGRRR